MRPHVVRAALLALTVAAGYGRAGLPLAFEHNIGQAEAGARYVARGRGYRIVFEQGGATLSSESGTVRMNWRNANRRSRIHGRGAAKGIANYLNGAREEWRTGIPLYSGVQYDDLYPGIDLAFYGSEGQLEYDFILHPGADPSQIGIRFDGVKGLQLDGGELVLRTADGELRHRRPRIYQDGPEGRHEVAGEYVLLAAREAGFRVPAYDRGRALIIDPVLSYSTYVGGSGDDRAWGIAVDAAGCAYVAGETWSANFPRTARVATAAGNQDAFVVKLNPAGTGIVYATYFGGRSRDSARSIAVDAAGNAYVAGFTYSVDYPTTAGALRTTAAGQEDAFIAKLNAAGTALVYSTFLGGAASDFATGIAVDAGGNAYASGYTSSVAFPVTVAAAQKTFQGGYQDGFIAKLNAGGSALIYATYVGGMGNDMANAVAVDSSGLAYVAGYTDSSNFPVRNAFRGTPAGQGDGFVVKVSSDGGSLVYATYLGGRLPDTATAVAVDASGNAYLTGSTLSEDFPVTAGAFQTVNRGSYDGFVTKLNAAGTALVYSTYLGGSGTDEAAAIAINAAGLAYVAGKTASVNFPLNGPVQASWAGRQDAFLSVLNASGAALQWSTYLGGAADDWAAGVTADSPGSAYVAGATMSTNLPGNQVTVRQDRWMRS
jgi:hypothetical protein